MPETYKVPAGELIPAKARTLHPSGFTETQRQWLVRWQEQILEAVEDKIREILFAPKAPAPEPWDQSTDETQQQPATPAPDPEPEPPVTKQTPTVSAPAKRTEDDELPDLPDLTVAEVPRATEAMLALINGCQKASKRSELVAIASEDAPAQTRFAKLRKAAATP